MKQTLLTSKVLRGLLHTGIIFARSFEGCIDAVAEETVLGHQAKDHSACRQQRIKFMRLHNLVRDETNTKQSAFFAGNIPRAL